MGLSYFYIPSTQKWCINCPQNRKRTSKPTGYSFSAKMYSETKISSQSDVAENISLNTAMQLEIPWIYLLDVKCSPSTRDRAKFLLCKVVPAEVIYFSYFALIMYRLNASLATYEQKLSS